MKGIGSQGRDPPAGSPARNTEERSDCCEEWYGHLCCLPPAQDGG